MVKITIALLYIVQVCVFIFTSGRVHYSAELVHYSAELVHYSAQLVHYSAQLASVILPSLVVKVIQYHVRSDMYKLWI